MKHKRILCIVICILMHFTLFSGAVVGESEADLAVTSGCHSMDANLSFLGSNKLVDNLQSAFVFETNSETLMYAWNPDTPLYPASLVKIMTALLVLEHGKLEDLVTVSADTINTLPYDAITADLVPDELIRVEDLMYCMMVQSANDAAAVLAEYISGTQTDFVALMNEKATELGCTGTKFMNPHGLHHDEQLTTARDTCRILNAALENSSFRDIFCTVWYTVDQTNKHDARYLSSNNYLMNTDEVGIHHDGRVKGGRTGVTADGHRCVASLSESGNMELICIVMGAKTSYVSDGYKVNSFGGFPETSALLDEAFSGLSRKQVVFANQVLRQQSVLNGDSDVFIASKEDFSVVLPTDASFEDLTYRYADAPGSNSAPITKGQNMASLQIWYDSICVAETDVYAMNDVPVSYQKLTVQSNIDEGISTLGAVVIVILVVLASFVIGVYVLRLYRRYRYRIAKRKHKGK